MGQPALFDDPARRVWRIVVDGPVPRKNNRTRVRIVTSKKPGGKSFPHYHPTKDWEDWVERLALEAGSIPKLQAGAWGIRIWTFTDRQRHLDGDQLHLADGDVDSATSAVLDGLKAVGAIDDDARFIEEHATKHYDKARPRVQIELTPLDHLTLAALRGEVWT